MLPIKIDLPLNFLKEEIRDGYKVSSEMKAVWAVELDMLAQFQIVCDKYNITWWMDGGSLLGTIRHKGFIPWDDDIDIMVPRMDYDRLCKVARKEFKNPYFFQTELSDHGSLRGHAQIRNSLTTGILKSEESRHYNFNQGIFIDIFPLDSIPDSNSAFESQLERINNAKAVCRQRRDYIYSLCIQRHRNFFLMTYNRFKGILFNTILYNKYGNGRNYRLFEKEARRYVDSPTNRVGNLSLGVFYKNWAFLREDYEETIYMPFEFLRVPVPKGYERRLTFQYEDWKTPAMGQSLHSEVIYNPYKSYKLYNSK